MIDEERPEMNGLGRCPLPLRDYPNIIMGHGGGGRLSAELLEHIFLPSFDNKKLDQLGDSTLFEGNGSRLAFSTDSYVVQPLFFPGGSIGDLAVNGTVNDLAMSGSVPKFLSAGFILEEGFPIEDLIRIARDMGRAADRAGVSIIAGDTKVVERGHGDGCYINTSGVGFVPKGVNIAASRAKPGDAIIVSGWIGDHGMAIMSVREGLEFESSIESDSAPLGELVQQILGVHRDIHVLRDPTRGGVAASLNEIAKASDCGMVIKDASLPIRPSVRSACEILGLDPLLVANEGKLLCFVEPQAADGVLRVMRQNPLGRDAALIGEVVAEHKGMVVAKTTVGTNRVVTVPIGEQLPRIC